MIRDAIEDDYTKIAQLNVMSYREFAPFLLDSNWEMMQRNLSNIEERAGKAQFLVFCEGANILGSVAYCPAGKGDISIFKEESASVLLLAVNPTHRGEGIAKALVNECIARAIREGAEHLALFTSELMTSAQQLYLSFGFTVDLELPSRQGVRFFRFGLPLKEITNQISKETMTF